MRERIHMSPPIADSSSDDSQIGIEAGYWLLQYEDSCSGSCDDDIGPQERDASFLKWVTRSPEHLRVFLETHETYLLLGLMDPCHAIDIETLVHEARILTSRSRKTRVGRLRRHSATRTKWRSPRLISVRTYRARYYRQQSHPSGAVGNLERIQGLVQRWEGAAILVATIIFGALLHVNAQPHASPPSDTSLMSAHVLNGRFASDRSVRQVCHGESSVSIIRCDGDG